MCPETRLNGKNAMRARSPDHQVEATVHARRTTTTSTEALTTSERRNEMCARAGRCKHPPRAAAHRRRWTSSGVRARPTSSCTARRAWLSEHESSFRPCTDAHAREGNGISCRCCAALARCSELVVLLPTQLPLSTDDLSPRQAHNHQRRCCALRAFALTHLAAGPAGWTSR